jgi:uncharacterized protein YndB with AHSA1/START domain
MDIIHELEIETTPEKLFEALSTDKGISAWWTKAKTQAKVGGINEFAFRDGAVATFRVEKLEPGKAVAWSADQVPPDWNGTEVLFEMSSGKKGGPVTLRFGHTGFKTMTPLVAFSSYAWAQYLRSLKLFLETGTGEPFGSPASLAAGTTPRGD